VKIFHRASASDPAGAAAAERAHFEASARPRTDAFSRERQLDLLVGALVLAAYVVGQFALLQGPHPFDPAYYFQTAVDYPHISADWWTLRIGLVGPLVVLVHLFHPSVITLYALPFLVGLGLAAAVYWTMLVLFRDRAVAAAAALVSVLNADYLLNSAYIFPDTAATATFTAGFLFLVLGAPREGRERRPWVPTAYAATAGFLFGWTYLIREFSPILLPAVVVAFFLLHYPLRRVAVVAGTAVATAAFELVYGAVQYGDPLIHLHTLVASVNPPEARLAFWRQLHSKVGNPLDATLVLPRLLLTWDFGWAMIAVLVVLAVGLALRRDRRLWLLAGWCFSFWAAMIVFALWQQPSGKLLVNVSNVRYWYPILPALVMGGFGAMALLGWGSRPSPRRVRLVQVAALAAAAVVLVPGSIEFSNCGAKNVWRNEPAKRWDELRSFLSTTQAQRYDVIQSDRITLRLLPAYTRSAWGRSIWTGRLEALPRRRSSPYHPSPQRRTLVLVHQQRLGSSFLRVLHEGWVPVFRSSDGAFVLLAENPAGPQVESQWSLAAGRGKATGGSCGLSPYE
jgi:hypothetical protein